MNGNICLKGEVQVREVEPLYKLGGLKQGPEACGGWLFRATWGGEVEGGEESREL